MKTKEIKEMNKTERLNLAIMIMNSYKRLMVDEIASQALGKQKHNYAEMAWRKDFMNSVRIVENMMKMRCLNWEMFHVLRK